VGAASAVFVALDGVDLRGALGLVAALSPLGVRFKVGLELFCREGPRGLSAIQELAGPCLLDLKLHDIPRTVERAVAALRATGAWGVTVHAAGGPVMLRAAAEAAAPSAGTARAEPFRVLAVTVLTSLDEQVLHALGVRLPLREQVSRLATLAAAAGCDGVVCSPEEVAAVRAAAGPEAWILTPGVRPEGAPRHDQSRVATPAASLGAGADAVVIGRPVTEAPDPRAALAQILGELDGVALRRNLV
jgi:orotidine-5'-phosphate decarboxylase